MGVCFDTLESRLFFSAYYVNAAVGNDLSSGRSPNLAWQTLAAVNAHAFRKGDKVLLTGTFTAQSLVLGPTDAGVTVTSYAVNPVNHRVKTSVAGAAVINGIVGTGVAISTSNVSISDLILNADPAAASSGNYNDGIDLENHTAAPLSHITINNVSASGFAYAGLNMQGWNTSATDSAGFSNVLIENSAFYGNMVSGIFVGAGNTTGNEFTSDFPASLYVNSNLTIKNVQAYNNAGFNPAFDSPDNTNPNDGNATNGGIFVSSVNGAIIENCTSYNNAFSAKGGVGIWTFDSTRVNFLSDESYDNKSASGLDGDGFDFDHGTVNSIMQRDYSHGNAGAGFLITSFGGATASAGITVRFCISDDNAQQNADGEITIYSIANAPVINTNIYNNTVLTDGAATMTQGAIWLTGDDTAADGVNILNNIFYTSGTGPVVTDTAPSATVRFEGNDYWLAGAPGTVGISWGDTTYTALTDWTTATGEETFKGTTVGFNQEPLIIGEEVSDLPIANVGNLALAAVSPLRKEGLVLSSRSWAGTAPYNADAPYNLAGRAWNGLGGRNYFNRAINVHAIGAG